MYYNFVMWHFPSDLNNLAKDGTHTTVQRPFVQDYPSSPAPQETFTHSHPSCSSDVLYRLFPSTTMPSVL